MALIVQKYGGSSVADLERLQAVADRIRATRDEGHQVAVVVSAMGTTTSELLALAGELTDVPDRRELDMLVSVGERISMALLAIALRARGVPARSLTGSQAGIVTDEAHGDARVVEVRPARLRASLDQGEVPIIAGFQGVSREREVTTLGRGGSDTTAVVLAAALDAGWCELCSDVEGVWSADPRVVGGASRIDTLSLDEALALARGGARILFEDAVRYARDHGIELRAVATFGPGAGTRLTVRRNASGGASAVTSDDRIVKVRLPAIERAAVIAALRAAGARLRRRCGERLYLDVRNLHGASLHHVHRELVIEGPCAVITAVGSGLGEQLDEIECGTAALLEAGLWVVEQGAEGDAVWWEVPSADAERGVNEIHRVLVRGEPTALGSPSARSSRPSD